MCGSHGLSSLDAPIMAGRLHAVNNDVASSLAAICNFAETKVL